MHLGLHDDRDRRRTLRSALARRSLAVLVGVLGCVAPDDGVQSTPHAAHEVEPCRDDGIEEVVLDGCRGIVGDDRCELAPAPSRLRLWQPPWATHCTIALDGRALAVTKVAIDGGARLEIPVEAGAHELTLQSSTGTPVWRARLVDAAPDDAELQPLHAAIARRRAAFVREDWDGTLVAAAEAFALADRLARHSDACAAAFAAAHVHAEIQGELDDALVWLDRTASCLAHDRAQLTRLHHHRGRIAALAGDERNARTEYRAAARAARQLGRVDDELAASAADAELARAIGDGVALDELVARITELSAGGIESCLGAIAISNVAWAQLMLTEHRPGAIDPRPMLRQALATSSDPRCMRPSVVAHTRLNLALAELHAGAPARAAEVLDAVDPTRLDVGAQHWRLDLRIRVALARGTPSLAVADLDALERAAVQHDDGELRWRASLRRGEIELALGQVARARRSLQAAERQLDRLTAELALELGRPQYLAQHGRSAELLVASLVDGGALDEAACVARRARARAIRSLELAARVRDDGTLATMTAELRAARDELDRVELDSRRLPGSELARAQERLVRSREQLRAGMLDGTDGATPPPLPCTAAPGDVLTLRYTPHGTGWIAFAHDRDGIEAATIDAIDPHAAAADVAALLLAPFRARVDAASRIHLAVEGELLEVPFHALPWHEGVLVDHAVVAWSADLAPSPAATARTTALVTFADAQHDLAHLRAPTSRAAAQLQAAGWRLHSDGEQSDRGPVLRRALAEVDLFHYLGHVGVPSFEPHRTHPWSTMLLLREGTFGIDDVLGLPAVPAHVVLLGCGTALAGPQRPGSGEGLAQAFLAAGAREVIAAVGDLDAELAARIGAELYTDTTTSFDAAAALARAQRRAHADEVNGDPWVLRAWVR